MVLRLLSDKAFYLVSVLVRIHNDVFLAGI